MLNWYQNPPPPGAMDFPILSLIVYLPVVFALIIMFFMSNPRLIKIVTNVAMLGGFILSVPLYLYFDVSSADYQFVEKATWFKTANGTVEVGYHFGLDGISLWLFLLTTLLGVVACLSSWAAVTERVKEYYVFLLLLQAGMLGVFVALDFVLFYVFWEVMLVPMYFLIGVWGGENRLYAAIKFFLYTLVGSVLMLLGILAIFFHHGEATNQYTFDIPTLTAFLQSAGNALPTNPETWLFGVQGAVFLAFFLAFAIKVPMFPFHTWLPDAHVQAPTAGSVILAGVLLKMGTYGFIRFSLPMFAEAVNHFLPYLAALAIIGIVYGALVALKQEDMKKLVAYSSVSHMGFLMLGLLALNQNGLLGGMLQMINHGLSTGALFLIVGVVYERRHTKAIKDFGGLSKVMPIYAVVFAIATMSSIGLPALNGFIGEFTLLVGVFQKSRIWAAFGATGIVLGAVYMLWLYQRTMFGPLSKKNESMEDLSAREIVVFAPIVILCFWIGLYPKPFIEPMEASIEKIVAAVNPAAVAASRAPVAPRIEAARLRFETKRQQRLAAGHAAGHGGGAEDGHGAEPHDAAPDHDGGTGSASPSHGGHGDH